MKCDMTNNISIRNITKNDYDWVKQLWYSNRDTLSIPYGRCIEELCSDINCLIVELNNVPIAMGTVVFKKRLKEYRIEHLVVSSDVRGKGIGTLLLFELVSRIPNDTLIDLDIVACAVLGADNNKFYDRFCVSKTIQHRKTKDFYRYVLDKRRICDGQRDIM